jgi:hypothetical protein
MFKRRILAAMETIWIIGAGQFGMRAVTSLSRRYKNLKILLVDQDCEKLDQASELDCITVHSDGVVYLETHLKPSLSTWIVPAVPIHLVWEWCRRQLGPDVLTPVNISSGIDGQLPHPMRGSNGEIYVSHADFICPINCSEPHDICTVTQQPRKQEMFKLLAKLRFKDFSSLVIQSHQLAPGVGGYSSEALFSLLKKIEGVKGPFLYSTACRCHGVITGGIHKG